MNNDEQKSSLRTKPEPTTEGAAPYIFVKEGKKQNRYERVALASHVLDIIV